MTASTQVSPVEAYDRNHQHPANRVLHAIGIPVIAACGLAALVGPNVVGIPRRIGLVGVALGSALLIIGHGIEGNRPAFFRSRRAVPDAVRWWGRGAMRITRQAFRA